MKMDTVRLLYPARTALVTRLTIIGQDSQDRFEGDKHQREGRRRDHRRSPGNVRTNTDALPPDASKPSGCVEENSPERPEVHSSRDHRTPRLRLRERSPQKVAATDYKFREKTLEPSLQRDNRDRGPRAFR